VTTWPSALRGWEPELTTLPREVALSLGPLVTRIAPALGAMQTQRALTGPSDAGLGGLSRRGSYERLLLSEWALAEELPDEFLRRAAGNEHLFLAPIPARPAGTRACTVLLDPGPELLGAPRLAALAALIALARRARLGGAVFRFRKLGDDVMYDIADADTLRLLLAGRTTDATRPLPEGDAPNARSAPDDVWLISGPSACERLRGDGTPASCVVIRDVLSTVIEAVDVEIRPVLLRKRDVRLPLPPARTRARILQDPAAGWENTQQTAGALPTHATPQGGAASDRVDVSRGVVFASNGEFAFVVMENGVVECRHLPRSPSAPAGRTKRLPPIAKGRWVAVGRVGRRLVGLARMEDGTWHGRGLGAVGLSGARADVVFAVDEEPGTDALLSLSMRLDESGRVRWSSLVGGRSWVAAWLDLRASPKLSRSPSAPPPAKYPEWFKGSTDVVSFDVHEAVSAARVVQLRADGALLVWSRWSTDLVITLSGSAR